MDTAQKCEMNPYHRTVHFVHCTYCTKHLVFSLGWTATSLLNIVHLVVHCQWKNPENIFVRCVRLAVQGLVSRSAWIRCLHRAQREEVKLEGLSCLNVECMHPQIGVKYTSFQGTYLVLSWSHVSGTVSEEIQDRSAQHQRIGLKFAPLPVWNWLNGW